jgi:hypothetical protein
VITSSTTVIEIVWIADRIPVLWIMNLGNVLGLIPFNLIDSLATTASGKLISTNPSGCTS